MNLRCALEFGTRHVTALEGTSRRILRYGSEVLDQGVLWEGVPQAGLADVLRRLRGRLGLKAPVARLAIPEVGTTRRETEIPSLRAGELQAVVGYLAKRIIPMDPAHVYYAWHLEPLPGRRSLLTVQAAWRDAIDGYDRACRAAGLRVEWIDLKPVALARALAAEEALAADWALGELTLTLIRGGRPVAGHTVPLASAGSLESAAFESAALAFDAALAFLRRAHRDLPLAAPLPLFLCGRFASVPDLALLAQERFSFPLRSCPGPAKAPAGFVAAAAAPALGMLADPRRLRPRITLQQVGGKRVA